MDGAKPILEAVDAGARLLLVRRPGQPGSGDRPFGPTARPAPPSIVSEAESDPSVRIIVPDGSTVEAELQRLAQRVVAASPAAAFQKNLAIQGVAGMLGSHDWPTIADRVGFGTALSGSIGANAVSALAAHQIAATALSGKAWGVGSLFPAVANMEATIAGVMGLTDRISGYAESLKERLMPFRSVFEGWEQSIRELGQRQQEVDENTADFVRRHGWPVPMCLPYRTYSRIVGLADRGRRDVSRAMVDYYRSGSKAMRSCSQVLLDRPALSDRRPIVRQALRAHRRGEHYLVIGALLPLIEGVLVDAVFAPETVPWRKRPEKAIAQLRADDDQDAALHAVELLVVSGAAGMGLLDPSHPRDATQPGYRPRTLNRHSILHGYGRSYGSRANALKMILLLTVLVEVVERHYRTIESESR